MKKISYALSALAFVSISSLVQASEWKEVGQDDWKSDSVVSEKQEQIVDVPAEKQVTRTHAAPVTDPNRWGLRVGMINSGGTYTIEDSDGDESPEYNLYDGGFEISLVSGIDKSPGFDFRSALTFQKLDGVLKMDYYGGEEDIADTSTMLFSGEFEFAYVVNEYVTPFIGFSGGLGVTDVSADGEESEDNLLTSQLGAFVGVSGDFHENFGYYVKIGMAVRVFTLDDYDYLVKESLNPINIGLSYTF